MGKKSGFGSGMNNPDQISESGCGCGSGMENIRIRDPDWGKFGSGINIPDPQHCYIP
jgi:hypothetical protein